MITEQAAQCGYCYNGQIIKGAELLFKTPQPTEAQIRSAMNGHICRCGTYPRIMSAIQRAARDMAAAKRTERFGRERGGNPCLRRTTPRWSPARRRARGDPALARRDFLKTTGVVVVGLSVADTLSAQGPAPEAPAAQRGLVSGPPDPAQIDSYVAIHPDNTATIFSGYVELGQGGPTALRQVAAEELDLDLDQVKDVRADTFVSTECFHRRQPDGWDRGRRTACGSGRSAPHAPRSGIGTAEGSRPDLTVAKGVVSVRTDRSARSHTPTCWAANRSIARSSQCPTRAASSFHARRQDNAIPKRRDDYRIVGTRVPRPDIAEKIRDTYEYVQHVRVPGMLTAASSGPRTRRASASAVRRSSASTNPRSREFPESRSSGGATSWGWWRLASGTRSARHAS